MRLNNEQITKRLKILQKVEPSEEFARSSRHLILNSEGINYGPRLNIFSQVTQSLNFAVSLTLVAVLFLVVILGGVFSLSKTLFLPPLQGINDEGLVTEANIITKDINLRLNEIGYFGAHKSSTAVAFDSKRYESRKGEILVNDLADQEIDRLLNQVINTY